MSYYDPHYLRRDSQELEIGGTCPFSMMPNLVTVVKPARSLCAGVFSQILSASTSAIERSKWNIEFSRNVTPAHTGMPHVPNTLHIKVSAGPAKMLSLCTGMSLSHDNPLPAQLPLKLSHGADYMKH
jgi:hypothetical protein